ncbi:MAG: hypothetical protein ABI230_03125 [Aestuariivirga sp.]
MLEKPVHIQGASGFVTLNSKNDDEPSCLLDALRQHIAQVEKATPQLDRGRSRSQPWIIGIPEIDAHIASSGLARSGIHDISPKAYGDIPAATGMATALALRRLKDPSERRPLLWCRLAYEALQHGNLYGHGFETLGLARNRFVTITLKKPLTALWMAEEALKSGALSLVIVDVNPVHASLTTTRRLSLAAAAGKSAGLLVFAKPHVDATASSTRWIVAASRSQPPPHDLLAPGLPSWNLELTRTRGGRPGAWAVEWVHASHRFNLVSELRSGALYQSASEAEEITTGKGLALRTG